LPTPKTLPDLAPADSPLLHTKTLNFSRFRSTGLNRTIYQSLNERFVTTERLLTLLRGFRLGQRDLDFPLVKNLSDEEEDDYFTHTSADEYDENGQKKKQPSLGRLEAVGFTEYMDSSITVEVLEELLFRGGYLAEYEEPEEPAFMHESDLSDFASSSNPIAPISSLHLRLSTPYPCPLSNLSTTVICNLPIPDLPTTQELDPAQSRAASRRRTRRWYRKIVITKAEQTWTVL